MKVGDVIGQRYEILSVIGEGGMGIVYEAKHKFTGRRVAIKTLHAAIAQNDEMKARFLREAEAAAAVRHPNIAEVYDAGLDDEGAMYIAMEFLEGRTLGDILEQGAVSLPDIIRIGGDVLDALEAAHQYGFVHRDIKPDNVFLVDKGNGSWITKVVDFGIAKQMETNVNLTQTHAIIGTPAYMSPEQAKGLNVDGRSDLWSAGAMLFHALTGRELFEAPNYNQLIVKVIMDEPPDPRQLNASVPADVASVVMGALARDVTHRYQRASDMAAALRSCRPDSPFQPQTAAQAQAISAGLSAVPAAASAQLAAPMGTPPGFSGGTYSGPQAAAPGAMGSGAYGSGSYGSGSHGQPGIAATRVPSGHHTPMGMSSGYSGAGAAVGSAAHPAPSGGSGMPWFLIGLLATPLVLCGGGIALAWGSGWLDSDPEAPGPIADSPRVADPVDPPVLEPTVDATPSDDTQLANNVTADENTGEVPVDPPEDDTTDTTADENAVNDENATDDNAANDNAADNADDENTADENAADDENTAPSRTTPRVRNTTTRPTTRMDRQPAWVNRPSNPRPSYSRPSYQPRVQPQTQMRRLLLPSPRRR